MSKTPSKPYPKDLSNVEGDYRNDGYGILKVEKIDERSLSVSLGGEVMKMNYRDDGLFHIESNLGSKPMVDLPYHAKIIENNGHVIGIQINYEMTLWYVKGKRIEFSKIK